MFFLAEKTLGERGKTDAQALNCMTIDDEASMERHLIVEKEIEILLVYRRKIYLKI